MTWGQITSQVMLYLYWELSRLDMRWLMEGDWEDCVYDGHLMVLASLKMLPTGLDFVLIVLFFVLLLYVVS